MRSHIGSFRALGDAELQRRELHADALKIIDGTSVQVGENGTGIFSQACTIRRRGVFFPGPADSLALPVSLG